MSNPKQISDIVAENYRVQQSLRKERLSTVKSFTGYVYGMTIVWSTVLFIAIEITELLVDITRDIDTNIRILSSSTYDMAQLTEITYAGIIVYVLITSILLRIAERKPIAGFIIHYIPLIILSFLAGYGVKTYFPLILGT